MSFKSLLLSTVSIGTFLLAAQEAGAQVNYQGIGPAISSACTPTNCNFTQPTNTPFTTYTSGAFTATLQFTTIPEFGETDFTLSSNGTNGFYIQDTDPNNYTSLCFVGHTNVVHGCIFHPEIFEGTVTATITPTTAVGNSSGTTTLALSSVVGYIHKGDILTFSGGPVTVIQQQTGTLGSNGNYTTSGSTTLTNAAIVDTNSSVMAVSATSTSLNIQLYSSVSGGTPTSVATGVYIFDQSSGTGGQIGSYDLIGTTTIASPETLAITTGGLSWGIQCSPNPSFGVGKGCYLPPQYSMRQEWNDPTTGQNFTYYFLNVDNFHDVIIDQISGGGWVPFGVQYATGDVGFGCAGIYNFTLVAQAHFCQQAAFTKTVLFTGGTSAPSPGGGAGSISGTGANGLELRGDGSTYDAAFINAGGSIGAGLLRHTQNFQIVGGGEVGSPTGGPEGTGTLNVASGYYINGTAGLTSKTCTFSTTDVAAGVTVVITGGIVTATTGC